MNKFKQVIVIPDVHGRTFWKEAVKGKEDQQIIFLGDYVDPYPHEEIDDTQALENFKEILEFKKNHPDNVILLIGNHDCSYMYSPSVCNCRYSFKHWKELQDLFRDNKHLFQMAYECEVNDKVYEFSHAGISDQWVERVSQYGNAMKVDIESNVEYINRLYNDHQDVLVEFLKDCSWYRGGSYTSGSCVWSDVREWVRKYEKNTSKNIQVFGHTQLEKDPYIIPNKILCLDCRKEYFLE